MGRIRRALNGELNHEDTRLVIFYVALESTSLLTIALLGSPRCPRGHIIEVSAKIEIKYVTHVLKIELPPNVFSLFDIKSVAGSQNSPFRVCDPEQGKVVSGRKDSVGLEWGNSEVVLHEKEHLEPYTSLPAPPRLRPVAWIKHHQTFALPCQGATVLLISGILEPFVDDLITEIEERGISSCRKYKQRDSWCQLGGGPEH